jgi:hypothetical protein
MRVFRIAAIAVVLMVGAGATGALPGCTGSLQATSSGATSSVVGAQGGSVTLSGGTGVTVPAGALPSNVTVTVTPSPSAPTPAGTVVGTPYTFGPEGQKFSSPVTVTLAFDPSEIPAGSTAGDIVIYTAPAGTTSYTALPTSIVDSTHASALTTHFSTFVCVVPSATVVTSPPGSPIDAGPWNLDGGQTTPVYDDAGPIDANTPPGDGSAEPPAASGPATTVTVAHNFAIHHLHLGDELDPTTGAADWASYGYDIDHKDTTATSTDVCALAANASTRNQVDGPNGIDNSFGENIVPLLAAVVGNPSATEDTALANGQFTLMFDVKGLDESNLTQTATGLSGQIFGGLAFNQGPNGSSALPTFTAGDEWPLDPTFLPNGVTAPVTSNELFASPYIANGTFVGPVGSGVTVSLLFQGAPFVLKIQHPVVTFVNGGTHQSSGIISGVILTQDLVSAFQSIAGNISTAFCGSSAAFQQVVSAIEQSADIMHDGTNAVGAPCDAISIGLGFDADEIGAPQVAGTPATAINPCAGVGDGG